MITRRARTIPLNKPLNILVPLLVCLLATAGCKDSPAPGPSAEQSAADTGKTEGEPSAQPSGEGQAAGTNTADQFGTAVIRGTVRFEGKRPRPRRIKMQGDHSCSPAGATVFAPGTVVSQGGGVPHVFVYIKKGIRGAYAPPAEPARLDQKGCMFAPHVFGIQVGQPLRITNSDPTSHNVHGLFKKNTKFNISQPVKGMSTIKTFSRPEVMAKFRCDVHGWMTAYGGVLRHPFFGVSDAEGVFEISRLPPGDYVLEAWHELWGTLRQNVSVKDGQALEVTFTYRRDRKSAARTGAD